MTFSQIIDFACAKVGKIDSYAKARCAEFVTARHRAIYESYNWKAAQTIIQPATPSSSIVTTLKLPGIAHVVSVRVNGELLDPVSTSYVFESFKDDFDTPSTMPKFYDEFYDNLDQTPSVRFYPPLDQSDDDYSFEIVVLGKLELNDNATHVSVPHTENALIAFVLGDMWEYLHQVGKAQAKFQEANALLKEAQDSDTPPATRIRMSAPLTATGNSLEEMTDSVCNLIGKFDPDTKVSVQERIRRNYQTIANAALWPDLNVVMTLNVSDNGEVIVPPLIDRVIAVRTNLFASEIAQNFAGNAYELRYQDIPVWFGIQPEVFETVGAPLKFSYKTPVAVLTMPPQAEQISFTLSRVGTGTRERISVFVKGLKENVESYESLDIWADALTEEPPFPNSTLNLYDTPIVISKPITKGTLTATGADTSTALVTIGPNERERKHLRLWLLPNSGNQIGSSVNDVPSSADLANVLVFGKQKVSPLVSNNDTCQIRNAENILINAAAADMMATMGQMDRVAIYRSKADALMAQLVDGETKQGAYEARIIPYTEPMPFDGTSFS